MKGRRSGMLKREGGIERNKAEKVHGDLMIVKHNENQYHALVSLHFPCNNDYAL